MLVVTPGGGECSLFKAMTNLHAVEARICTCCQKVGVVKIEGRLSRGVVCASIPTPWADMALDMNVSTTAFGLGI